MRRNQHLPKPDRHLGRYGTGASHPRRWIRAEAELRQAEALETLARAMLGAEGRVILTDGTYLAVRDGDFLGVRRIGAGAPDGVEVDPEVAVQYCNEAVPADSGSVRELGACGADAAVAG